MAANVQRRIGFRKSAAPGRRPRTVTEFRTALGHCGENIIAGAVEDPMDGEMVSSQPGLHTAAIIGTPPATLASNAINKPVFAGE